MTKSTPTLTTLAEVVSDIRKHLTPELQAEVANTKKGDLIEFHHSWGRHIRNRYNLWWNSAVLKDIGETHPDDASMVIIKAVWQQLRDSKV